MALLLLCVSACLSVCVAVLIAAGEVLGDVFEVSRIRREDYEFHKGKSEYEDILQCNNLPSSATPRGHQTPAAFLIMASGLDKVGTRSQNNLCEINRLFCTKIPFPSTAWTPQHRCHIPTLTLLGPAVLFLVSQQEPRSSPWQPNTFCLRKSK